MNRKVTQASKVKNSYYFELDSHLKLIVCYYIDAQSYILIQQVRQSVSKSDKGFGGWGRDKPVKQRATGVSL